jgi:prepilin-type N-terminal cleavage/methylation domain-containing protein
MRVDNTKSDNTDSKASSGFTIIEVLLALALLLVLALPLLQWMHSTNSYNRINMEHLDAGVLLHNFSEEIRAGVHDELLKALLEEEAGSSIDHSAPGCLYRFRLRNLGAHSVSAGRGLLQQVELSIIWRDQWGRERSYVLVLALAETR